MEKAFKYRIYPNREQRILLAKTFGCTRFVYNHYLAKRRDAYEKDGIPFSYSACAKDLVSLKKEYEWLKEVDSVALQSSVKNLDTAYINFFKKKAEYPRFKSKKTHRYSYTTKYTNGNILQTIKFMKYIQWIIGCSLLFAGGGNREHFDATGTFEATEVIVSAEASGRLLSFDIEEGTTLKDGQEVGIIDTVQLYLKKLQLEASVKSVEGQRPDILKQVAATQEQIVQARRERDRVSNLLRVGAANQKQLDDAESLLEVLRKQLDAQNSTLRNSDRSLTWQSSSVGIQVAQIEDQLRKCHITSPLTGTVLAKYAEAGELAAPGTPLFKVADMEQIYLRAYITSEQLAEIKLGQQVKVYADYGKDVRQEYPGVVTWISDTSEFTPKTILTKDERANLVYAVKIAVKNDGMLKIGMYGGCNFN